MSKMIQSVLSYMTCQKDASMSLENHPGHTGLSGIASIPEVHWKTESVELQQQHLMWPSR